MANIASLLKGEIARIVRKELKGETLALRKAVGVHRKEIAALKRRARGLEFQVRQNAKASAANGPVVPDASDTASEVRRFSAKGLRSQRSRLGISAAECGVLVGVSSQSIYNWEEGKARPRAKHLAAIAALRRLGKKDAAEVLAARKE